jgi:hypothetical protein
MRQLQTLGSRLERGFDAVEAQTATPARALALGVGLALGVIGGGLIGLFVLLKLLTAIF